MLISEKSKSTYKIYNKVDIILVTKHRNHRYNRKKQYKWNYIKFAPFSYYEKKNTFINTILYVP